MQVFSSGAQLVCSLKLEKWGESIFFSPPPPLFPSFALEPTLRVRLLFLLSLIFLRHNKDGGYNSTNINKQLSPAQNTPALQAKYYKKTADPLWQKPLKELQIGLGAGNFLPSTSHRGWGIFWKLAGQGFRNYIKEPTRARGKIL